MGLFSRLGDIINSNINAMLDSAENPEKMARLMVQEMEDVLVSVRTTTARHMADKKEMAREIEHFTSVRADWVSKAELAIEKDREDLARGALLAKQKAETEIERRKAAMSSAEEAFEKGQEDLKQLQAKLDEAKAKQKSLQMRRETAQHRIQMRSQMHDGRVDEVLARYSSIERKVDEMEAYADTIKGGAPSLEAEFAALERNDSVEAELEALKAKRSNGSTKAKAKKAEG
jgi:phage shock protein A